MHLKANRLDAAIADYNATLRIDAKGVGALYGRGVARLRKGDAAGAADIEAAKAIQADIAEEYAKYGIR